MVKEKCVRSLIDEDIQTVDDIILCGRAYGIGLGLECSERSLLEAEADFTLTLTRSIGAPFLVAGGQHSGRQRCDI